MCKDIVAAFDFRKERKKKDSEILLLHQKNNNSKGCAQLEGVGKGGRDSCRASHFGYVSVSVEAEANFKSKLRHIEGDYPRAKSKGDEAKGIKSPKGVIHSQKEIIIIFLRAGQQQLPVQDGGGG